MNERPDFNKIESYNEFIKYYWYRDELKKICKSLGIASNGTKQDLNYYIEQYFNGNIIKDNKYKASKVKDSSINLNSKLLECGFCFNQKFREYFSKLTNITNFKFNADMASTWRMVKKNNDKNFTIQDMLDVYYGKKEYARYDNSSCQWNKFFKDFCADKRNSIYTNKIKVASILWNEVRNSTREKIYTEELIEEYANKIKNYQQ